MLHWLNVQLNATNNPSALSRRCRRYDFDVHLIIPLNSINWRLAYNIETLYETADRAPLAMSWTKAISQMAISICHVQFFPLSFCTVENNEFVYSIIICFDAPNRKKRKQTLIRPRNRLPRWWLSEDLLFHFISLFMILHDSFSS